MAPANAMASAVQVMNMMMLELPRYPFSSLIKRIYDGAVKTFLRLFEEFQFYSNVLEIFLEIKN